MKTLYHSGQNNKVTETEKRLLEPQNVFIWIEESNMFKANSKVGMLRSRRPLVLSRAAIEIRSF